MLEYPKNYEEAKRIIKNSVGNDYENRNIKKVKLKAAFITAVGVAAGITVGAITKNMGWMNIIIPNAGLFSVAALIPLLRNKLTNTKINNDDFFKIHTKEEIMEIATKYVKEYNEFERKKEGKSR